MELAKNSLNVRRSMRMIFILQGNSFQGLRLKQLAVALQTTPSTVLRDLEVMADEGIVERIPGREEHWRLSPRLVQVAHAHAEELTRMKSQLNEFDQRYTRLPK